MPFYILNRTQRTLMACVDKKWPLLAVLGDFVRANDTLELVELRSENLSYYGLDYIHQSVYTISMERVNREGKDYVPTKQRAIDWLAEQKRNESDRLVLPKPRCNECFHLFEDLGEVQSIRDFYKCCGCRAKLAGKDVVVPRRKK